MEKKKEGRGKRKKKGEKRITSLLLLLSFRPVSPGIVNGEEEREGEKKKKGKNPSCDRFPFVLQVAPCGTKGGKEGKGRKRKDVIQRRCSIPFGQQIFIHRMGRKTEREGKKRLLFSKFFDRPRHAGKRGGEGRGRKRAAYLHHDADCRFDRFRRGEGGKKKKRSASTFLSPSPVRGGGGGRGGREEDKKRKKERKNPHVPDPLMQLSRSA